MLSEFVTPAEVLAMLPITVGRGWLTAQCRTGNFPPAIQVSPKKIVFAKDAVERWIARKFPRDDSKPARVDHDMKRPSRPERAKRTPRVRN